MAIAIKIKQIKISLYRTAYLRLVRIKVYSNYDSSYIQKCFWQLQLSIMFCLYYYNINSSGFPRIFTPSRLLVNIFVYFHNFHDYGCSFYLYLHNSPIYCTRDSYLLIISWYQSLVILERLVCCYQWHSLVCSSMCLYTRKYSFTFLQLKLYPY